MPLMLVCLYVSCAVMQYGLIQFIRVPWTLAWSSQTSTRVHQGGTSVGNSPQRSSRTGDDPAHILIQLAPPRLHRVASLHSGCLH